MQTGLASSLENLTLDQIPVYQDQVRRIQNGYLGCTVVHLDTANNGRDALQFIISPADAFYLRSVHNKKQGSLFPKSDPAYQAMFPTVYRLNQRKLLELINNGSKINSDYLNKNRHLIDDTRIICTTFALNCLYTFDHPVKP